jgi:hypothetical protein
MQGPVLRPAIRKPRSKAKAKAAPVNPRQPIPRPDTDPETRLVTKDVVLTYRVGEADQPNLAKTIKWSNKTKDPVGDPNNFNWVLQVSDDGLDGPKFAGLQYENDDKCAKVAKKMYNNARCDACGQKCNVLYVVRCYKKRDLDADERQMEKIDGRVHHDIRLRDNGTPRALHKDIMYFGQDCVKSLFRSRAAGDGDAAGETSRTGNGHEEIATARTADKIEVDTIIGWGKASNCPSARAADVAADARGAFRFAIDKAEKAIQSSNEQATLAKQCRAEGERVFLEITSLLPPNPVWNSMSLTERKKYVRDAGPQLIGMLEQKAGEVGVWFARAQDSSTLARETKKAFDDAKRKLRVIVEICEDQQLKDQASSVTSTNELVDNEEKAKEACDFLLQKQTRSNLMFKVCRAMSLRRPHV